MAINDQRRDAMWRIMGRPIAREIGAVDLNLSEGAYVARSNSSDHILILVVD